MLTHHPENLILNFTGAEPRHSHHKHVNYSVLCCEMMVNHCVLKSTKVGSPSEPRIGNATERGPPAFVTCAPLRQIQIGKAVLIFAHVTAWRVRTA